MGINLDSVLRFEQNVNEIVRKVSQKLSALAKLSPICTFLSKILLEQPDSMMTEK